MTIIRWADVQESVTQTAIIQLMTDVGWGDIYPNIYVTSAKRDPGAEGYASDFHNTYPYQAVDFSWIDISGRDIIAIWWYKYSGYMLELIHENDPDTDAGWYVKNGIRVGSNFYGDTTD